MAFFWSKEKSTYFFSFTIYYISFSLYLIRWRVSKLRGSGQGGKEGRGGVKPIDPRHCGVKAAELGLAHHPAAPHLTMTEGQWEGQGGGLAELDNLRRNGIRICILSIDLFYNLQ